MTFKFPKLKHHCEAQAILLKMQLKTHGFPKASEAVDFVLWNIGEEIKNKRKLKIVREPPPTDLEKE